MYNKILLDMDGEINRKKWPRVKKENVHINQPLGDLDTSRQELKETIINMYKDFKELMS